MGAISLTNTLSVLALITGVLTFVGALVNGKLKQTTIQDLQNSNDALRSLNSDLTAENIDLKAKLTLAEAQAAAIEKLRQAAVDIAQSRPAFETLGEQMIKQHRELLAAIARQSTSSSRDMLKLTTGISNLAKVMSKGA
jgi:Tfp pilus assembly protein PilN